MATIYILSEHGKLTKKDETIVFVQSDETRTILFPFKTEHLVIIGNVSISGDALRLLTKYKICTTFLSSNGRFNGKLSFGDSKNVFLRQRQYRILDNPFGHLLNGNPAHAPDNILEWKNHQRYDAQRHAPRPVRF